MRMDAHRSVLSLSACLCFAAVCVLLVLPASAESSQIEKLTSHPAVDYSPAPSEDGRYLAFVSERTGNPDIWLKSLATGVVSLPRQLTTHPAADRDPSLNPDGSRLLYVSHKTDPRGDIYLLNVASGDERRLTDQSSADTAPQWTPAGDGFYFLKQQPGSTSASVVKKSLSGTTETTVVEQANSFAIAPDGSVVYANQGHLYVVAADRASDPKVLTVESFLDVLPSVSRDLDGVQTMTMAFTRYERDTNGDGLLDADDESSIWVGRLDGAARGFAALFRVTPSGSFHLYAHAARGYVYYADLVSGDLYRLNWKQFLADYASFDHATSVATAYRDKGDIARELMVLTNISRNLAANLSAETRAYFNLAYAESLAEAGHIGVAEDVLTPLVEAGGKVGALAQLERIVLDMLKTRARLSSMELKRQATRGVERVLAIGSQFQPDEQISGQALIDAGRLQLLAGDSLTALEYLTKVEALQDQEARAKALFLRGTIYKDLGDNQSVAQVFADVITMFGEDSSWGRRAVAQTIAAAERGPDVHRRVAALQALISQYPQFPYLAAAVRFRIAELYDESGEQIKAIQALNQVIENPPPFSDLVERSYRRKAEIFSAREQFQDAAETYAALRTFTGVDQPESAQMKKLMVNQLVKQALKERNSGEIRIAAKALKQLTQNYPESVEAHRGYIETKVMLKETADVQAAYLQLMKAHPNDPVFLYAYALALSYSEPPNFSAVARFVEQAIERDPSVSYYHQTLGWAYEQQERVAGKVGLLEKAEKSYRLALDLNDEFLSPEVESNLLLNLGNTYMALANYHEAYHHYHRRDLLQAPTGNVSTELLFRKNYGEACFKAGRSEEAIVQYRQALNRIPDDNRGLRAQLLERIGLAHQDLGQHSEAVQAFSASLEINLELGNAQNVALLQRNIGVNLYNLSTAEGGASRQALKDALKSQFASLNSLKQFGAKEQKKGQGLLSVAVALGQDGSAAASGFDRQGEEKLMFSYIAGTYEKLAEPASSREYYLKKLDLLPMDNADDTNAARLAEKAVVLNRLGLLSHQLGRDDEALDYFRQSLGYTQTLKLAYGTGVNLYNLAWLLSQRLVARQDIEWSTVERLVAGLDDHLASGQKDAQTFYALCATAFLLHHLSSDVLPQRKNLTEAVSRLHALYGYKSRVWPYYARAQEMVKQDGILEKDVVFPTLIALKHNMLEVAAAAGEEEKARVLQDELMKLASESFAPNAWLGWLAQAERAKEPASRKDLLRQAFHQLTRFPPHVYAEGTASAAPPAYDRLASLWADTLVAQEDHEQALVIADQIEHIKQTGMLYDRVGEDFFLTGLGDYEEELRRLFADIRSAGAGGRTEELQALSLVLQEMLSALYEEYPAAASAFWLYPLTGDTLSSVLGPERVYLKIVSGQEAVHVFVHDGQTVHYGAATWKGERLILPDRLLAVLANARFAYLSVPENLRTMWDSRVLEGKLQIFVSSLYDILNGYHHRSLFYSSIALTENVAPDPDVKAGPIPLTARVLTGHSDQDQVTLAAAHLLVATKGRDGFAFEVTRDLGVREMVRVTSLVGGQRHTALVFNAGNRSEDDSALVAQALLRAGFPHVMIHAGSADQRLMQEFLTRYVMHLEAHPAGEAMMLAAGEVAGLGAAPSAFVLYGYAGMEQQEKAEFASSRYSAELNAAVALYQEGAYRQALSRIENALSVIDYAQKLEDRKDLTKLAVDAAFQTGNYGKAVTYQRQLLDVLGDQASAEERSEALYRLGILYSRLEEFEPALQHLQQAIELWTQQEQLDRLAEGIGTLGVIRENMGAYSDALRDFTRSHELYQEIGEIGDVASQHRRIGRIYYLRLARYEQARQSFLAALTTYQSLDDRRGEAETLFEIGLTYEKMGLFEEADKRYQEGKRIGEEIDDPYIIATGHLYLANTAWFRGDYQNAFHLLTQAERLAGKAGDAQLPIMVKNTRGLIYWTLNDTDKGLMHLKQAVALAQQADIKTELASSWNNLGLIYRQRGEYGTSLEYFEKAKGLDEALNSRWGLGYDYRNIGMALLKMGKLVDAEANFIKAEQVSGEIKNAVNWVKALLELGNVNRELNRPEKAMEYFQRAYDLAKRYGIKEVEWRAAGGIAWLLRKQGARQDAFGWYAKAVDVVEGMRAALKIDELRNSFQANKLDLYRETISLLVELGRADEAFNYLERSRSRSFIDLLGNQKLTLKTQADQQALDRISALSGRVESLKKEVGSYDRAPAELESQYREAKALYDEAVLELKQNNPSLSSFVSVDPLTIAEVRQLLEPGVALYSYMLDQEKSFLWVLERSGTTFYEIPAGESELTSLVQQYRSSLQHLEPVDTELRRLYALLIGPTEKILSQAHYVGLIPDGALHFLSFAALKSDQGYLVDRVPLFYTPSASVLKFTFVKREKKKETKVLAVGNPDLGNYNYDLPLAELEAKSIRWNYPDMDILTGAKASKEWFVENTDRYGIIHLAAHGEFDEFNPLLSSLWLASDNPDDRKLTVKEVFGLELNADLVTLSACQTGLGKLEAGELIGLNRAFLYAGTHALVSALWRVDDLSTSVLMKHFYRSYTTMDKAKSLRQAQLIVKKEFPHPSYWAAMSLIGDYQ